MDKGRLLEEFIENLRGQIPVYRLLLAETRKQLIAVQGEDYTALNAALVAKDALLHRLAEMEQEADGMKEQMVLSYSMRRFNLTELSGVYSEGRLDPLRAAMEEMGQIMSEVIAEENSGAAMLRENMDKVEEGLRKLRSGRQAISAYQPRFNGEASAFLNEKG